MAWLAKEKGIGEVPIVKYECIKKLILKYMPDWNPDTYVPLYCEYAVYSFRKMVVQRRKMLGMTQKDLSEKCCCDIATIERMEQGLVDTQSNIAYQILNAVGLPIEKSYYLLQTSSYQVKEDYLKEARAVNENRLEEAKHLLCEIRDTIDMSLNRNQQLIAFEEAIIYHKEKMIPEEKKIETYMEILSRTIPKDAVGKSDIILYGSELNIVRNIAMCYENAGNPEMAIALLEWAGDGYSRKNSVGEENVTYNLVVSKLLESIIANKGNFEKANQMLEICIPQVMRQDITGLMLQFMYDKVWNEIKQNGNINKDSRCEIDAAYQIAILCKIDRTANYIKNLINNLST